MFYNTPNNTIVLLYFYIKKNSIIFKTFSALQGIAQQLHAYSHAQLIVKKKIKYENFSERQTLYRNLTFKFKYSKNHSKSTIKTFLSPRKWTISCFTRGKYVCPACEY